VRGWTPDEVEVMLLRSTEYDMGYWFANALGLVLDAADQLDADGRFLVVRGGVAARWSAQRGAACAQRQSVPVCDQTAGASVAEQFRVVGEVVLADQEFLDARLLGEFVKALRPVAPPASMSSSATFRAAAFTPGAPPLSGTGPS
jgi:hypothetical protein